MKQNHEVTMVSVSDLKPYEANARTHSDEQVTQLMESIKAFGFNNPILVQEDLTIVAGHGRLMAAQKLGLNSVPVITLKHLTAEQARAYVLADNKLALNSGWDNELLKAELIAIQEAGEVDLSIIGFSPEEMADIMGESGDEDSGENYSKKIDTPIYEPKGNKPDISVLLKKDKAESLTDKIISSGVSEVEKAFLIQAAQRHVIFDYTSIAEYYCHASKEMQGLMEDSALVIIDFNKAIEGGYVALSKQIEDIYSASYDNESDDEA
jgi:ParB/RepB/Spo0J family partition protein